MSTGKHIGKVLIKIREEEPENSLIPPPKIISAVPRFYCDPKKTYIIIGKYMYINQIMGMG